MLAVTVSIPGEWLVLLPVAATVLVYLWGRRAAQSSVLTESRVLTEKSVRNIEELWEKRDAMRDKIEDNRVDIAYLKGVREGEKKSKNSC